jgi:RND family efflux transporter MFP subunit
MPRGRKDFVARMSIWKQTILCLVLVVGAAAGWYVYKNPVIVGLAREDARGSGKPEASGKSERGGEQAGSRQNRIPGLIGGGAVNVVTAPVETDASGDTVMSLGTAKAVQSVTLYPEVAGTVALVNVVAGKKVEAGDILVQLYNDEQKVAVEKAEIALEQAQGALERQQTLAKSKTTSSVALSDAETAARMAEVELKTAKIDLGRRSITAPFSGLTGLTDLSIGDFVNTTTALATVDDLSTMRVDFEIPERWSGRVREGQKITATAQALPGSKFEGSISGVDNRVDPVTRTLRLQADIVNYAGLLKTGMAIMVSLEFDANEELAVPSLAVQWDRRGSFVWKLVDSAVRRADVAIIRRQSGIVVLKGEIAAGDHVIVEGLLRLREGAKVTEVNQTPTIVEESGLRPGAVEPTAVPASDGAPAATGAVPASTRS